MRHSALAVALLFTAFVTPAFVTPAFVTPALAATTMHARSDSEVVTYTVAPDLSYVETIEMDATVFTQRGIQQHDRSARTFYPDKQSLEVLEAWTQQPDGTRLDVPATGRFTRPSQAAQGAPGFSGSLTTTVVFPQLREGSRTHVKFRLTQKTVPLIGFNVFNAAALETASIEDRVEINLPAGVPFTWRTRGPVEVVDVTLSGVRRIVARMAPVAGEDPERNSVSATDFLPIFVGTSLPDLKASGAIYYQQARDKAAVTPAIAALAERIAGNRTGLDAARAVYDWVTVNIRYIAVFMNENDGWVPHSAAEVLANGYGDCKDHVVIMQALLAARGITAQAAIIDWGTRFEDLPLWMPFFNHAILYLPDQDLYLNPTNPYARFETLDRTLADKLVVIATEQGRVARTPPARPQDNAYRIDARVRIEKDGTINGQSTITAAPNHDASIRAAIANASSPRDLAEQYLTFSPEGGLGEFHAGDPRDLSRPLDVAATWQSPHGVVFQGTDAYLPVPFGPDFKQANRLRSFLTPGTPRRHPIFIGATDFTWTNIVTLPAGTSATRLPADIDLHTTTGTYVATYRRTGNEVTVQRHLVIDRSVYRADEYSELERLLYAPIDDARSVIVLGRTEAAVQ